MKIDLTFRTKVSRGRLALFTRHVTRITNVGRIISGCFLVDISKIYEASPIEYQFRYHESQISRCFVRRRWGI